jgi:hypothetical protein
MVIHRRRSRKRRVDTEETEQGANAACLVDSDLVPDAEQAARSATMSFIDAVGRRAVSVFLDRDDYEKVGHMLPETLGCLMLECLPAFAHGRNGQIALTTRLDSHGIRLNPVQRSVEVNGRTRNMLYEGFLFIHFPDERVVVSVEPVPVVEGWRLGICVRSSRDSAEFWRCWWDFAREHNYLRGQAFFADGKIIERKHTYSWDDILLPEKTKRMVRTHVEDFLRNRLTLKEMGVKARRGLILAGPPGTGKTLLGKVLSDTLDASFMWVSPRHVANTASFDSILTLARFVTPTVVFLEDLDLFAEERVFSSSIGLGELMNQLDGALDNEDLITIATTNRLDVIEKALRNRPGRFDRVVELEAMDKTCRRGLLKKLLTNASVPKADMGYIVQATDGYTGAQLEELSNTLYILAVRNDNTSVGKARSNKVPVVLDRGLIDSALSEVHVERKRAMGFHVA